MAKRKAAQTAPATAAPTAKPPAKKARFSNPPPPPPAASSSTPRAKPKQKGKAAASSSAPVAVRNPAAPKRFTVAAGSYERLLYGLECSFEPATAATSSSGLDYELSISPIFSFPAHLSSLRTVAASTLIHEGTGSERRVGGKYLVSGGSDEIIKVWDLPRRKEVGSLEGDTIGASLSHPFLLLEPSGARPADPALLLAPSRRHHHLHALRPAAQHARRRLDRLDHRPVPRPRLDPPPRAQGPQGPGQLVRRSPGRPRRAQRRRRQDAAHVGPRGGQVGDGDAARRGCVRSPLSSVRLFCILTCSTCSQRATLCGGTRTAASSPSSAAPT